MFQNLSSDVIEDLLFFIYTGNTPNLAKVEARNFKFLSEHAGMKNIKNSPPPPLPRGEGETIFNDWGGGHIKFEGYLSFLKLFSQKYIYFFWTFDY